MGLDGCVGDRACVPNRLVVLVLFLLALAAAGCGSPEPPETTGTTTTTPAPCEPGELTREDGSCQAAGLAPDMPCPAGELLLEDGCCQKAGVPASQCGEGFVPDGEDGCEPVLPADPCPEGTMAVPGETQCHEVMPCGSGTWGDIPVEANTQFVDQAYAGGGSDGSMAKPWTTIQAGIDHAKSGAIVAVAAGTYPEDVEIHSRPVRLWGRCPAMVEITGIAANAPALRVVTGVTSATEVHGVAVTGPAWGIAVSGPKDVLIARVRVHDTGHPGIDVENALGPTSVVLRGSLIEQSREMGAYIEGSDAVIEATVVRSTQPDAQGQVGRGIHVQGDPAAKERAGVTVRGCVVEQNHEMGVHVEGSDAVIEATVVRSTGWGIDVEADPAAEERADVTVRGCVVEQSDEVGVWVEGSDAVIEATVVRSTRSGAQGQSGLGIGIERSPATKERADVTVRGCVVEQNHYLGVYVSASDAVIEATVVRSTEPDAQEQGGRGIAIQGDPAAKERANVAVRGCVIEQNRYVGVFVSGSEGVIEATVVRSTEPDAQGQIGWGIAVEAEPATKERADVTVRGCVVEQNHDVGVIVFGSDAVIEATVVRFTQPDAGGQGGEGIDIHADPVTKERANVTVRGCVIEQNRYVGVFVSGSEGVIEATVVRSTMPDVHGLSAGMVFQDDTITKERASTAVRGCVVEQNQALGVVVGGSDVVIEATVVRSTQPDAQGKLGRGLQIQNGHDASVRGNATVRGCVVEKSREVGVFVVLSDAVLESTVVRDTAPQLASGQFGDGIIEVDAEVTLQDVESRGNARAGLAGFGGEVAIGAGVFMCNGFDVNLEVSPASGAPGSFGGHPDWECSKRKPSECTEPGPCKVEQSGIQPPPALPSVDPL